MDYYACVEATANPTVDTGMPAGTRARRTQAGWTQTGHP